MNPNYDFKGQVALVTGAAKGMGLATARMFAESGAAVVLADLDGDLAAAEAERIVADGGTAIGIACDVAEEPQVVAMVDHTVAKYGRLDMAFGAVTLEHCLPVDGYHLLITHAVHVRVGSSGRWRRRKSKSRSRSKIRSSWSRRRRDVHVQCQRFPSNQRLDG